jgi:hypothetical protein
MDGDTILDQEKMEQEAHKDHEAEPSKPIAPLHQDVRNAMGRILDNYLIIQQKLKGDTLDGVQPVAVEIATLSEQVKSLDKAHALHSITAGITGSAPELLSGDIETTREGFKKLSRTLTDYVKRADPDASRKRGLKIFYCPMVKEEWIQKGEAVENPYYGKVMLKCGNEVKY